MEAWRLHMCWNLTRSAYRPMALQRQKITYGLKLNKLMVSVRIPLRIKIHTIIVMCYCCFNLKNDVNWCLLYDILLHINVLLVAIFNLQYDASCILQKFPPPVPTNEGLRQYRESVLDTHAKKLAPHQCANRSYDEFSGVMLGHAGRQGGRQLPECVRVCGPRLEIGPP